MEESRYDKEKLSDKEHGWERFIFLLNRVELMEEEMQWLLAYLENTDAKELYARLYSLFKNMDYCSSERVKEFDQGKVLHLLHEKIFK